MNSRERGKRKGGSSPGAFLLHWRPNWLLCLPLCRNFLLCAESTRTLPPFFYQTHSLLLDDFLSKFEYKPNPFLSSLTPLLPNFSKRNFQSKIVEVRETLFSSCCCGEPFVLMCCEETLWLHSQIKPCLTLVLFPTRESELSRAIIVLLYSVAYTPFWHQRHTVRCNYKEVWIIDAWTVGCRNYMSTKNNDDHYPVLRWESSARWQSAHLCRF